MGLLDAAYYLGSPVGMAVAGPLLDGVGYRAAFIMTIGLYVVTVVYVAVRFRNEKKKSVDTEVRVHCGFHKCAGKIFAVF